jgi:hypothetical protein
MFAKRTLTQAAASYSGFLFHRRTMIAFLTVLELLQRGNSVELKFRLACGLFTRHTLTLVDGKIKDFSYVDESTTKYSLAEYRSSQYGEAFEHNTVEIIDILDPTQQLA